MLKRFAIASALATMTASAYAQGLSQSYMNQSRVHSGMIRFMKPSNMGTVKAVSP
jgi:hypothetical protein